VKRAMKDLLASKLLVLVEQGGVTADGQNECNLYQLMVPTEPKARIGGANRSADLAGAGTTPPAGREPGVEPLMNPPGVRHGTPSRLAADPPAGPEVGLIGRGRGVRRRTGIKSNSQRIHRRQQQTRRPPPRRGG
jgi:hypothetical protein